MTDKQKRFCDEYLTDLNATNAAIKAGYSEKTAYSIGQRLLKKVEIKKYIEQVQNDLKNQSDLTKESILNKLKNYGFADIDNSKISPKDAIKALEVISKMLGYDIPPQKGEGRIQELIEAVKII